MSEEEIEEIKELMKQDYFGDMNFSYYGKLINKLLDLYIKEKDKNEKMTETFMSIDKEKMTALSDSFNRILKDKMEDLLILRSDAILKDDIDKILNESFNSLFYEKNMDYKEEYIELYKKLKDLIYKDGRMRIKITMEE